MEEKIILTNNDLQILADLDSRQFGFIKLNEEPNQVKKSAALKAINYLERVIVQSNILEKRRSQAVPNGERPRQSLYVDVKTYIKLGHLHLLLGDFDKALSAYQKFYRISKIPWKDASYLYGLGLVYYHFNALAWACQAFQQVLYVEPGFLRANEVHLRLGIIFKVKCDFDSSYKHLTQAKSDCSPCTMSQQEIIFHISHLHEVCGKYCESKQMYEELLEDDKLSNQLKADIYRQLGWMFHSVEEFGEKTPRIDQAIAYLNKSIEADPKSGQSLYLLGRCYATVAKVHDAFIAYRNSVDKSESNADTWCSIGVLYQQQNQPMDALQAYICAVQLDKDHSAAWTNLGILYESQSQPQDALACYTNATRLKSGSPNLNQRIKYLKGQLGSGVPTPTTAKTRSLPSVEEAWNLPISNEMTNRQNQPRQGGNRGGGPANQKKDDNVMAQQQQHQRPPFYLNQQQLQQLQFLQNQPSLTPQQQQILHQLQNQFRLMQQHQQQMRVQSQQQQQQIVGLPRPIQPNGQFQSVPTNQAAQNGQSVNGNAELDGLNVSDKELESLLSQQDIGSFAESLLKQFQEQIGDSGEEANVKSEPEPESKNERMDVKPDAEDLLGRKAEVKEFDRMDYIDIPTTVEKVVHEPQNAPEVHIKMNADEILEACLRNPAKGARIPTSMLPDDHPLPSLPDRPFEKLAKEQLLPPTPSVYLENKKDACSPQLHEFCIQHPITVVRGIAAALKLDLGLFSTKQVVEIHPEQPIRVKTQIKQSSDENWDQNGQYQVWSCPGKEAMTTMASYAKYQVATFQEAFHTEQEKTTHKAEEDSFGRKKKKPMPMLKHAYCIDLSEEHKFRSQLQELCKLPHWMRVVAAGNMLSHVGYPLSGMNTVRLSMKVPGARSPARQENNNFCSVNMNIGPGDCEWFGVPEEYWGVLHDLCEKNGVNFIKSSWWPSMKDLMDAEVPVYRFLQRPGDLVWVNHGCIHWMQASGWSNNIEWNVGSLTHRQYSLALERYEWNKLQGYKSVVPMVHLSWNLARNIRVSDSTLYEAIKHTLMKSLRQIILTLEFARHKGLEIKYQAHGKGEPTHNCSQCENEVYGVLFIREEEEKHVIFCLDCAKRRSDQFKGFVVLEEYQLLELKDIYNHFKLANPNQGPGMGVSRAPYHSHSHAAQSASNTHHTQIMNKAVGPSSHPLMSSSVMGSLGQMTPQQLALQQALQQQAMLNP